MNKNNYYHTKESVDEYIRHSENVNGLGLIIQLKNFLAPQSSLLELGSGPGNDFKLLLNDYQVVGSDYSVEFLHRLKANYPSNEFLQLDATTLKTDKKFDGIYSNKVLQHLTDGDLLQSVKRQAKILNAQGTVCHSFWKGGGQETFKGMLVNYQTSASLSKLFEDYFEILAMEEYQEFEKGDSLLLIAMRK